jgi:hypothetical protein
MSGYLVALIAFYVVCFTETVRAILAAPVLDSCGNPAQDFTQGSVIGGRSMIDVAHLKALMKGRLWGRDSADAAAGLGPEDACVVLSSLLNSTEQSLERVYGVDFARAFKSAARQEIQRRFPSFETRLLR